MLRISSTQLSDVSQLLMMAEKDEVDDRSSNGMKSTITSKKSLGADYQISDGDLDAKRVPLTLRALDT